jgi:hypothetical protein
VLETVDFVTEPGFLEANPSLVESYKELENLLSEGSEKDSQPTKTETQSKPQENKMSDTSKELLDSIVKENAALKGNLEVALEQNKTATATNEKLAMQVSLLEKEVSETRSQSSELAAYKKIGEAADIQYALKLAADTKASLKKIGTVEQVQESKNLIAKIAEKLGVEASAIIAKLEEVLAYQELGSVEEVKANAVLLKTANESLEAYKAMGTPEEIQEALKKAKDAAEVIATYEAIGTADEIQEAFKASIGFKANLDESKAKDEMSVLAKELKVDESKIVALAAKGFTKGEIQELFVDAPHKDESHPSKTYKKTKIDESVEDTDDKAPAYMHESSAKRLMGRFQ